MAEDENIDFDERSIPVIKEDAIDSNALKWQLSLEYDELEHNLKGEFWDEKKEKWFKMGSALMNNTGIKRVMTFIRPLTSKNLILSNLSPEMIGEIMISNCDTIRENLINNMKEYGIDKRNLSLIYEYIKNFIYPALKRCEKGGERSFIKGGVQRIEQFIKREGEFGEKKKKGWLF